MPKCHGSCSCLQLNTSRYRNSPVFCPCWNLSCDLFTSLTFWIALVITISIYHCPSLHFEQSLRHKHESNYRHGTILELSTNSFRCKKKTHPSHAEFHSGQSFWSWAVRIWEQSEEAHPWNSPRSSPQPLTLTFYCCRVGQIPMHCRFLCINLQQLESDSPM